MQPEAARRRAWDAVCSALDWVRQPPHAFHLADELAELALAALPLEEDPPRVQHQRTPMGPLFAYTCQVESVVGVAQHLGRGAQFVFGGPWWQAHHACSRINAQQARRWQRCRAHLRFWWQPLPPRHKAAWQRGLLAGTGLA